MPDGNKKRLTPTFECDEPYYKKLKKEDKPDDAEQGMLHFNPRSCPQPDCTGVPRSASCCLYECSVCDWGPTRQYHFAIDVGKQEFRLAQLKGKYGNSIAREMIKTMDPDIEDHCDRDKMRYLGEIYTSPILRNVATAMQHLYDALNALLAHTNTDRVQINDDRSLKDADVAKQMRQFCWDLIVYCPLTQHDIMELITMQMATGNVFQPAILGWTVNNCVMFMHDESRNLRMITTLKAWHDAKQQLLANCSYTRLSNDFLHALSYSSFTCLIPPIFVSKDHRGECLESVCFAAVRLCFASELGWHQFAATAVGVHAVAGYDEEITNHSISIQRVNDTAIDV